MADEPPQVPPPPPLPEIVPLAPLGYEGSYPAPAFHVQPLEYSLPAYRRPGLVTAIGVMSIIVGSLGIVANIGAGLQSIAMLAFSQFAPMVTASSSVSIVPSGQRVIRDDPVGPHGLSNPTRQLVVTSLRAMHPLSETRARQLDALLSQAGQDVFPFDASQITPARVRSSVSESGTLPGARNDLGEGADYFILGNGRIELVDQQAVFYPAGSAQPIRAAADANDDASSMVVQSQAGSTAPTGAPAPTTVPAPTPLFPKISAWPALLAVGESLLSLALAIYLLVIGILVFRGSPNSARQHRIYAIIKIPLALLAGFAWGYVWHQMMASMPFRSGGLGAVFVGYAIVMALLSMGYPIGLLLALQSRKVREFYATARC